MGKKILAVAVVVLGLANMAVGITFIAIGATKQDYLSRTMEEERITVTLSDEAIAAGEYVDTAAEAQAAGDLVRSHRHDMGTYDEVLGGDRFDPSDLEQLTYAQALNLENYLYLAVASFGLTTMALGAGVGLLLAGIALILVGAWIFLRPREVTPGDGR